MKPVQTALWRLSGAPIPRLRLASRRNPASGPCSTAPAELAGAKTGSPRVEIRERRRAMVEFQDAATRERRRAMVEFQDAATRERRRAMGEFRDAGDARWGSSGMLATRDGGVPGCRRPGHGARGRRRGWFLPWNRLPDVVRRLSATSR